MVKTLLDNEKQLLFHTEMQASTLPNVIIMIIIIIIHYHRRLMCQRIFPTSRFIGLA
jgi:hypothetical protein